MKLSLSLICTKSSNSNPPEIKELDLSSTDIDDIDESVQECTGVRRLNLAQNRLSTLASISLLSSLNNVNLSHNSISDITPLFLLCNLSVVNLSFNKIPE